MRRPARHLVGNGGRSEFVMPMSEKWNQLPRCLRWLHSIRYNNKQFLMHQWPASVKFLGWLTKVPFVNKVVPRAVSAALFLWPSDWEVVQLAVHQILDLIILVRVQASQPIFSVG